MKLLSLFSLCSLFTLSTLTAQQTENTNNNQETTSQTTRDGFWDAKLPGGMYMVALKNISSVSMHTYYVGNMEIKEVVIDTNGNALARFYVLGVAGEKSDANIAKNTIQRGRELMNQAGKRTGVNPNAVTKSYPHSTHAKTIEFRLSSSSSLKALYNSVKKAWKSKRGARFRTN